MIKGLRFLIVSSLAIVFLSIAFFGVFYPLISHSIYVATEFVIARTKSSQKSYKALSFEDMLRLESYRGSQVYFSPRLSSWKSSVPPHAAATHTIYAPEGTTLCLYGDIAKRVFAERAQANNIELHIAFDSRYNDMITESASGIDPHISPHNAYFQAKKIARMRGIRDPQQLYKLVDECTLQYGSWTLFPAVVDVILLNRELDVRFPIDTIR